MKKNFVYLIILYPFVVFGLQKGNLDQNLKMKLFNLTRSNLKGPNLNYKMARKYLFGKLHLQKQTGIYYIEDKYCGKVFTAKIGVGPMQIPDYLLLNCEHTWPQSRFNKNFKRRLQKNDLHHLYPVDSRSNSTRLNDIFAEVNRSKFVSNNCTQSKKGKAIGTNIIAFEPPENHKGNIARALFYFSIRYQSPISPTEELYLRRWHDLDPVDDKERIRNNEIMKIQKNRNPFIDNPALVSQINDF